MVYQDPGNPRRPDDYIDRNGDMGWAPIILAVAREETRSEISDYQACQVDDVEHFLSDLAEVSGRAR